MRADQFDEMYINQKMYFQLLSQWGKEWLSGLNIFYFASQSPNL